MVRIAPIVVLCALLATAGCTFGAVSDAPTGGGTPSEPPGSFTDETSVTIRATEDLAASVAAVDRRDAGNETLLNRTVALQGGEETTLAPLPAGTDWVEVRVDGTRWGHRVEPCQFLTLSVSGDDVTVVRNVLGDC